MERFRNPQFVLRTLNAGVLGLDAVVGWWWAFTHFALTMVFGAGLMLGLVMVALHAALTAQRGRWNSRSAVFLFVGTVAISLMLFVSPMLMASHPNLWLAVLAFVSGQIGYRLARGIRRIITELRAEPT